MLTDLFSDRFDTELVDTSCRWVHYRNRRINSLLRMQIANIIFLSVVISLSGNINDRLREGLIIRNTVLWLLPSLVYFGYLIVSKRQGYLSRLLSVDSVRTWMQVGQFLIFLRGFNVVFIMTEVLGAHAHSHDAWSGSAGNDMIAAIMLMDIAQAYFWTSFNFPSPWARYFCIVECTSAVIKLLHCRAELRIYVLHEAYPITSVIVYFMMLCFYHLVMDLYHVASFSELKKVRGLSLARAKELDRLNRSIKLALQFISGCLTKFEAAGAVGGRSANHVRKLSGAPMQSTLRSVQHITLLLDDIIVLTKLEEGPMIGGTCGSADLSGVLRDLVHGLEDPSVPKLMIHIKLNDAQTLQPTLRCSTAMLNSIIGNVALYAMTAIRRRAFRQRVGYKPYLNVVGYIVESDEFESISNFTYLGKVRKYVFGDKMNASEMIDGRKMMFRLVFDHNGDVASSRRVGESVAGNEAICCNVSKKCMRSKDYAATTSRELFDGTEIFQKSSLGGSRPAHNVVSKGRVFTAHDVPVALCRDAYSVNEDKVILDELSPLTIATVNGVVNSCGGNFLIKDFVVDSDEDASLRSSQFNRLIIDIPCQDNPTSVTGALCKNQSNSVLDPYPLPTASSMKIFIAIAEKQLYSSVFFLMEKMKIPGDAIHLKKRNISKNQIDYAAILKGKYTAVFFDLEYVGVRLRDMGYTGERVFFTPDVLLKSSKEQLNYEVVMPIPCQLFDIRQYIERKAKTSTTIQVAVDAPMSPSRDAKHDCLTALRRWADIVYWIIGKTFFFAASIRQIMHAAMISHQRIRNLLRWILLDSIIVSPAAVGVATADITPDFGPQFSFVKCMLMLPQFQMATEYKFISWRVYNTENGVLSHASSFWVSVVLIAILRLFAEWYRSRLSHAAEPGLMYVSLAMIFFMLLNLWLAKLFVKNEKYQYYILYFVFACIVCFSIYAITSLAYFQSDKYRVPIATSTYSGARVVDLIVVFPHRLLCYDFAVVFWEFSSFIIAMACVRTFLFAYFVYIAGHISQVVFLVFVACIILFVFISSCRQFELEYYRRIEYQTLSWHRFRTIFIQTCRKLSWNETRYPLKSLLKQRQKLFADIAEILTDRGHAYLSPDMAENARTLNLGFLKLDQMHSVLSFTDLCDDRASLELNYDDFLIKEEVAFVASSLELDAQKLNAEIFIMVDPILVRVKFDKQMFRMLLVNAVSVALQNLESLGGEEKANEADHQTRPAISGTGNVKEILIQIGIADEGNDAVANGISNTINFNFLKSRSGSTTSLSGNHITISVVDNGVPRIEDRANFHSSDKGYQEVCRKLVENGLKGSYEVEVLEVPSLFRNITRYTIPYISVDTTLAHGINGDALKNRQMWKSPSRGEFCGFQRPSVRYEFMRMAYSKRKTFEQRVKDMSTKDSIQRKDDKTTWSNKDVFQISEEDDDETVTPWDRVMLFVHPDVLTGEILLNNFAMHGWNGTVLTSLDAVLEFPELHNMDLVLICTSVMFHTSGTDFIPKDLLEQLGFFGALMCLIDAFPPAENPVNDVYERLTIPILDSTVSQVNIATDRALLNYIIGANRHSDF